MHYFVDPSVLPLFTADHPTGALGQRYLFVGEDGTPENFMLSLADNLGRFRMVRHRHNFDQFRFAISGDMVMGNGRVLQIRSRRGRRTRRHEGCGAPASKSLSTLFDQSASDHELRYRF